MSPISEARRKANEKYNAKAYDEIKVRVAKGTKQALQDIATSQGKSVNGYIKKALKTQIQADTGEDMDL